MTLQGVRHFRMKLETVVVLVIISHNRNRAFGVLATMSKPSGASMTLSPWLIQTFSLAAAPSVLAVFDTVSQLRVTLTSIVAAPAWISLA